MPYGTPSHLPSKLRILLRPAASRAKNRSYGMTAIPIAPLFPYARRGSFFTLGFPLDEMPATFFLPPRAVLIIPVYVDSVVSLGGSVLRKLRKVFNKKDRDEVGTQ